jgi:hypothetical protein
MLLATHVPMQHCPLQHSLPSGQQASPHGPPFEGSQHVVPFRQLAMFAQQVPPQRWSAVQQVFPKPHTSFAAQHVSPQTGPVLSAGHVMHWISSTSAEGCWQR